MFISPCLYSADSLLLLLLLLCQPNFLHPEQFFPLILFEFLYNIGRIYIELLSDNDGSTSVDFLQEVPDLEIDTSVVLVELKVLLEYIFLASNEEIVVLNWTRWKNANFFVWTKSNFVFQVDAGLSRIANLV